MIPPPEVKAVGTPSQTFNVVGVNTIGVGTSFTVIV
jgi:hypothetical protein